MPKKQPQLAKLSRPRLHKAVARERLFKLLDEKREHPVVWIVGPPGAGKTTLVASYLEEAGVPAIWYQIDPGDSDPATFFLYLKQAVDGLSQDRAKPLPLLTSEYLSDLPAFARQFLRDAFARLPDDIVLVLDNYQELAGGSSLHAALKASLAEVSQGANVLAISRSNPPREFAELLVNRLMPVVTWDDLRLTAEETRLIAASAGIAGNAALQILHARSGGWMAGLTLMLENLRGRETFEDQRLETLDTIFEYFAGLIFDGASAEMQDVLMKISFLPWVSGKLAEAATGTPNAIQYVEALHKRHLFTDRRMGAEPTYQFHALFRAFLQSRANAALPLTKRRSLSTRIAAEFLASGHSEEAFASFVDADDWPGAEKVVIESASILIKQGRWQTLGQWIDALPAARVESNPWIGYWLGRSATFLDPASARPILESAYGNFLDNRDEVGQLLTATTILEGIYFSFENLKPMDPWIDRVVSLLQRGVQPPANEDDLRVHSAVMMGATLRAPMHSMLASCLQRVLALLKEPFEPNLKVAAASMLHAYSNVAMDLEVERIAISIARPLLVSKELSPKRALFYWTAEGYSHYVRGRYAEAFACFDAADAIVGEHGIQHINAASTITGRGLCERRAGLLDLAEATTRRTEALLLPATGQPRARLQLMQAVVAFDRGNMQYAIESGLKAYKTYDEGGFFNGLVTVGTVVANMAVAGARFDIAEAILLRLRGEKYGAIAENYVAAIVLNQAWLEHRRGNASLRDVFLREALQGAWKEGTRVRFHWYVNALSELLPVALSQGIEADLAVRIAREFSVLPQPADVEAWPWPIKVYTLGRFDLLIDGKTPEYSRKMPRKVLALLKAVVAFGGSGVPEQKLMSALWPEEDGDAAHRSLIATLHRLRKLLGNARAVRQAGGELTLDPGICWVDAFAFESRIERIAPEPHQLEKAIDLYRGVFLAQEEDAPWAVPARERLRAKFIRAVARRASDMESAQDHEPAVALYLRGIEADPLVENFYQGLMRSYDRLNRRTEAASVYRRLRQTLSITLGVQPSVASQLLFDSLRAG